MCRTWRLATHVSNVSIAELPRSWVARRRSEGVAFDRSTVAMAALTVLTQAGGIGLFILATQGAPGSGPGGGVVEPPSQRTNPGSGVAFLAIVVAESLVIAGGFYLWQKLPERLRRWLKKVLVTVVAAAMVLAVYIRFGTVEAAAFTSAFGAYWFSDRLPFYWIAHNAMALAIGVAIAATVGASVTPTVAAIILIGLIAWDLTAVDFSDIMAGIVGASAGAKLPNYVVIPASVSVDFKAVREWIAGDGDKPASVANIIGLGDFVIPAVLTVAAYVTTQSWILPAATCLGACASMPFLSGAVNGRDGGVPALPWVNAGSLVGYALGWLLVI